MGEITDHWISCDERLPDFGEPVALLNCERYENFPLEDITGTPRHVQDAGYLSEIGGILVWSVRGTRGADAAGHFRGYTHWLPLPEFPQGEEDD